ncbi:MAG TPA: FecR domain-containing protein, partial [Kofleriaceae bacterium]
MKLRGRVPVEQLADERMTNIERRVVAGAADAAARGRRGHRLGGRFVLAAAMVAAGALGWLAHRPPDADRGAVLAEQGPVQVDNTGGRAVLDIGDARIASDPATAFDVTRPAGGVLVALRRGLVELDVDKRHGRPPLVVRAGDTDVIVVGTHFTVDYGDGHGEVVVRVTEGVVRVVGRQRETRVAAGQAWATTGAGAASAASGVTGPSQPGALAANVPIP